MHDSVEIVVLLRFVCNCGQQIVMQVDSFVRDIIGNGMVGFLSDFVTFDFFQENFNYENLMIKSPIRAQPKSITSPKLEPINSNGN